MSPTERAPHAGLTTGEAARRLAEVGPNRLPERKPPPLWLRFLRQFQSPLIYVLLFAIVFDVGVWVRDRLEGLPVEGLVIGAVLLLNAGLGAFQEHRSERALAGLAALTAPFVWVLRDGALVHLPSAELVPGDVVRIEAGERIPADGTIVEGLGILVDEAVLTGESIPVEKPVDDEIQSGTLVVRGQGVFRASRTGAKSAMGQIATMLAETRVEKTPLERRLGALGRHVAIWISALAVLLTVAGVFTEGIDRLDEVVMFAVALAVAGIPEGMPAVVTLTLALGVQRMATHKALVRRLSAVEALGSVTVIATDKTGTLTEERMAVQSLDAADRDGSLLALVLANDADPGAVAGDPVDVGLLAYAREQGLDLAAVRAAHPRVGSRPFDSAWKYLRVTVDAAGERQSYIKGAPEVVLGRARLREGERAAWMQRAERAASDGHKVLALAAGAGEREEDLTFLGLVALRDPPRAEVSAAIRTAQRAGIRVLMITGDHPGTARAVAGLVGLPAPAVVTGAELDRLSPEALGEAVRTANVFARVTPAHKLRLVEALQADGQMVAMTGDGVNDAPALKRADVGVAMGRRGSDVAREVADVVLLDDDFSTIVHAVEEGRSIYENIQGFIRFTFSTNVALMILVVTGALVAYAEGLRDATGMLALPLTALQLLWINFLGDGPPALALALDRIPGQMDRPPRPPASGLLDASSARFIAVTGLFKGGVGIALLVLLPLAGYAVVITQTVIFLYESIGKLVSVYPSRAVARGSRNLALHAAVVIGIAVQVLTVAIPGLRRFLVLAPLDGRAVAVLSLSVLATWATAMLTRRLLRGGGSPSARSPAHPLEPGLAPT